MRDEGLDDVGADRRICPIDGLFSGGYADPPLQETASFNS